MKAPKLALWIIFVLLFSISLTLALYFFILPLFLPNQLEIYLEVIKESQQQGKKQASASAIKDAVKFLNKKADLSQYKKLLKGVWKHSQMFKDYFPLEIFLDPALSRFPDQELFWALKVYSRIRQGRYPEAYQVAKLKLLSSEYEGLLREAQIKALYHLRKLEKVDLPLSVLHLFNDGLVKDFEEAARYLDNPKALFNAALLYTNQGDFKKAAALLHRIPAGKVKSLAVPFIYFDAGDFKSAYVILQEYLQNKENSDFQFFLFANDLHHKLNDDLSVMDNIFYLLREHPDKSPLPYLNMGLIQEAQNKSAIHYFKDAFDFFPRDPRVIQALAEYYYSKGDRERAIDFLKKEMPKDNPDLQIRLLQFQFAHEALPAEMIAAQLWELYADYPQHESIVRYLIWILLGANKPLDLQLLFTRISKSSLVDRDWYYFYASLCALLYPGFFKPQSDAMDYFKSKNLIPLKSYFYYNQAAALLSPLFNQKRVAPDALKSARDFLQKAEFNLRGLLPEYENNSLMADLLFLKALVFYHQDKKRIAKETLENVLKYNANHVKALAYLNQIQVSGSIP